MTTECQSNYFVFSSVPYPFAVDSPLPRSNRVQIKVFDILGNEIETLVNTEKPAGYYEIEFNAENLPSGIYFYRINAGEYVQTKKMILLK